MRIHQAPKQFQKVLEIDLRPSLGVSRQLHRRDLNVVFHVVVGRALGAKQAVAHLDQQADVGQEVGLIAVCANRQQDRLVGKSITKCDVCGMQFAFISKVSVVLLVVFSIASLHELRKNVQRAKSILMNFILGF